MIKKKLIEKAVEGIRDFKIIPFIGAGLSTSFGLKSWQELIDDLRKQTVTDEKDFLKVAQAFEDKFGRLILIDQLEEYYTIKDIDKFDTSLHELLIAMAPPIIYTTNYDTAIEQISSNLNWPYRKIACLKDIVECPHKANVIIKFHGDFSAPEEIVLTENDYGKRMALENPLDIRLRSDLIGKGLLFVGYSLRDKNINYILEKHVTQYGSANLPLSYIITFEGYITPERIRELRAKNVEIIAFESEDELAGLIKSLNENVFAASIRKQITELFKSKPSRVLMKGELENLTITFRDAMLTDQKKAEVIVDTIGWKKVPSALSEQVIDFYKEVISSDYLSSKEALITVFGHLGLDKEATVAVAIEMMELTTHEELNWGMGPKASKSITDVISTIEMVLGRELTIVLIFLYLTKCYEENRQLTFDHADRIFYFLSHYNYSEFLDNDYDGRFTRANKEILISHFLNQHPAALRNRFRSPLLMNGRVSGSEMRDKLLKNMKPFSDEL